MAKNNQSASDNTEQEQLQDEEDVSVPCDPELERVFWCLKIINEFRFTNDPALIDELIARFNNYEETSDFSSVMNPSPSNDRFIRELDQQDGRP